MSASVVRIPFAILALVGLLAIVAIPGRASAQADGNGEVQVTVEVSLPAEAHSSARDWYFEITNATGEIVDWFTVSTSAGSPEGAAVRTLPAGSYSVQFVFSEQVGPACEETTFFALAGPVSVTSSLTIDGTLLHARYDFVECPGAPGSVEGPVLSAGTSGDASSASGDVSSTSGDSSSTSGVAGNAPVSGATGGVGQSSTRFTSDPLPPATGTGLAPSGSTTWAPGALALVAASLAGLAGMAWISRGYNARG